MYVITNHNEQNFVLLGPITWRPRFISSVLSDDLDQEIEVTAADEARVPFDIIPGVTIRKAVTQYEEINDKIHAYDGPFWDYSGEDGIAVASFTKRDKPLSIVKHDLKQLAAAERWKREVAGIELEIDDTVLKVDTERDSRNILVQAAMLLGDDDTVGWKFLNTWKVLTKQQVLYIVGAVKNHVEECFQWEVALDQEIDACETLEELDAIVIVENNDNDEENLHEI